MDRENEDEDIGHDVRHDERHEDFNLVHAFPNALQRPLLLDRDAEECHNERVDDTPNDDHRHAGEDPVPNVNRKHAHVEAQLAELQRH